MHLLRAELLHDPITSEAHPCRFASFQNKVKTLAETFKVTYILRAVFLVIYSPSVIPVIFLLVLPNMMCVESVG